MVSRKTLKKNFKTLYTNKKVQLQMDFLISPAVAGLFFNPATAGRVLKILSMLLYEGIQE